MSLIKSRKHHALAAIAATLSAPLLVQAQTSADPQALPTIKVTADRDTSLKADVSANPKATAALLDTPQSIQIIPEQVMHEQAATTLTEALRNSAGVSAFYLGENGSTSTGDAIYMRGFDASSSIFIDGIRDTASISRDVFNIEQVEVVKGPAGADTGRSSPTGYINLVTKKPTLSDSFSGSVGLGTASFKRTSVDWNKALSAPGGSQNSGTAFRLNAVVEDAGVDGRDEIKNKRWAIAPSLALGLGSDTRVYLDLLHVDQDNVPDGGVPTIGLPGFTSPDTTRAFIGSAAKVKSSNFYGTSSDFDRVHSDMFTARVEHDVNKDLTLRNTTRYGSTSENYMLTSWTATAANLLTPSTSDPSTWTVARSNPNNKDQVNTILADQLNLSGKFMLGGLQNSISTGAEISREEQQNWLYYGSNAVVYNVSGITSSGAWPAANLYAPNPNVSGYQRLRTGASTDGVTTTFGAYLFDTLEFNKQWQMTGGLRVDRYRTSYFGTALVTTGATAGTLTPTNLAVSGSLVTGKIGLVYKPLDNGSVYVDVASGAQPPGGSNFTLAVGGTGNSASRTDFAPQKTRTYEVGTKWDLLDKALGLTGALYRTDVTNGVVQDPVSLLYFQTGKQRVQGIELGAVGQITEHWGVTAGATTMHTSIVNGPAVTSDGSNVLSYTPTSSLTFWTNYEAGHGITLGAGALYNAALHRGTDSAIGTPKTIDGYTVFNAMVGYKITRNVDLQLNLNNLFDTDYVAAINKSGYRYTPGTPRSGKLTLNVEF